MSRIYSVVSCLVGFVGNLADIVAAETVENFGCIAAVEIAVHKIVEV